MLHPSNNLLVSILLASFLLLVNCGENQSERQSVNGDTLVADKGAIEDFADTSGTSSTDAEKIKSDVGGYQLVDPSELSFAIEDFYYEGITTEEGLKPFGGEVGKLLCEGKVLELQNPEFEKGFIVTKDYGKIKIRFGSSVSGMTSFSIWLTPEQMSKLKELKGK